MGASPMGAAVVTLRLTPTEFALIVKALDSLISEDYEITKNSEIEHAVRAAARQQHVETSDLRSKLR